MAKDPFKHDKEVAQLIEKGGEYVLDIMKKFSEGDPNRVNDRTFRSCLDYLKFRQIVECRMYCLTNGIGGQMNEGQSEDFTDLLDAEVTDITHELPPGPDQV